MTRLNCEIAIIGGGLIGGSTALALARAGLPCVLIESNAVGARASGVNFGGVRRQGRSPTQLHLAARAHEIWPRLQTLIGTDGEYIRSGHIKLARTADDLASLATYAERVTEFGLDLEIMEGAQFRQRFPYFGPQIIGGSFCPEDGQANPRLIAPAFSLAAERSGAKLIQHDKVVRCSREGDAFVLNTEQGNEIRSHILVNATGAWGAQIAAQLGEHVPLRIKHPTMAVTDTLPAITSVSIGVEGGGFYARQVARGNVVMGGGFGEATGEDICRPGPAPIAALGQNAPLILPALANASIIRCWSGIEGYFDDKNPVLGPSAIHPGLFHAFGFSGAGFQISPAVGEVLAEMVRGKNTLPCAQAYSITRFSAATP